MSEKPKSNVPLLTYEELCLHTPLYVAISIPQTTQNAAYLSTLRADDFQFDAHCIQCDKTSTFRTARSRGAGVPVNAKWMFSAGYFAAEVICQRDQEHKYRYMFHLLGEVLQKVGQFPSMEDIAAHDLQRFRSVLDRQDFSELHRAGGLASHGIGIGAFVYLRRIFGRLIEKTRLAAIDSGVSPEGYERLRMDEKIGALADFLPAALVKNKAVYAILSKGLHELDEATCNKYFAVVRAAILQILQQELDAKNRRASESALEREIAKIHTELRSG